MANGRNRDGWDGFTWSARGEDGSLDGTSEGRQQPLDEARDNDAEAGAGDIGSTTEGRWVSQGGVLRWEDGEDEEKEASAQAEVNSHWAEDEVELPQGAPETLRIRAAHAWLARQRAMEAQEQGLLLLERRLRGSQDTQDTQEDAAGMQRRRGPVEESPLDIALAEHQAAIEEYERLIEELDDVAAHNGPARVLVEYHLSLTERLAELARAPEAPAEFAERLLLVPVEDEEAVVGAKVPVSLRAEAEWQGRAGAVLQARRRVEKVTAPEPED